MVATEVLEAEEAFQACPEDLAAVAEDKTFLLNQAVQEQLTKETLADQEVDIQAKAAAEADPTMQDQLQLLEQEHLILLQEQQLLLL